MLKVIHQQKFTKKFQLYFNLKALYFSLVGGAILFGLFFFGSPVFAQTSNPVYLSQQWLKLIRYNKTSSGYESEVDHDGYFFSKNGKESPQDEYLATIENFNKNSSLYKDINKHPVCTFPGRYIFLKRMNVKLNPFDLNRCSDFNKFKDKIKLKTVSVIFSSFYINKPASAFGHTLLKLNSGNALNSDLNSYSVDFSAQVTTSNGFLYGLYGMIGGFFGRFSLLPYFLKMREYNDLESRDLWEFELNFSSEDKELFLAHLWDMNLALFNYYYLSENCSYHILRFVDAVRPEWDLMSDLHSIVLPIDTLMPLINREGILKATYHRPSLRRRVISKYEDLNSEQKILVSSSIENLKMPNLKNKSNQEKAKTLDAMIDIMDYKHSDDIFFDSKNDKIKDFKSEVLLTRSQVNFVSNNSSELKIKKDKMNFGHYPRVFALGKTVGDIKRVNFKYRSALHAIEEPNGDVYSDFSLEMNKLSFEFDEKTDEFYLDKYEFAHVLALRPILLVENKWSWEFSFGAKSDRVERHKVGTYLNVYLGPSFQYYSHLFYFFVSTEFETIFDKPSPFVGPQIGWIKKSDNLTLRLTLKYLQNGRVPSEPRRDYSLAAIYAFNPTWDLNFSISKVVNDDSAKALVGYKF